MKAVKMLEGEAGEESPPKEGGGSPKKGGEGRRQSPGKLRPFGSLDTPRCPLCRYPLAARMTRKGPGSPCPCQNPEEDYAPLGPDFIMPPGTPGARAADRLRRLGILTK